MSEPAIGHALLQQLVAALADGELPRSEASAVQEHLRICARCQREMALQQGVSSALAREPAGAASDTLRRRIERMSSPAPRRSAPPWSRWAVPAAAAMVAVAIVGGAALVSIGVGRTGTLLAGRGERRTPVAQIPLLRDALADCSRAMARNFPRQADVHAVAKGLQFPVRALERPGAELFSTWKTTLAGSPAAGLAYRWRGTIVVQYLVSSDAIQRQPEVGEVLRAGGVYTASDRGQAIVALLASGTGTVLLADALPEELTGLVL
ncbi:MAG: zf-HC2 domain-containing protein [Myxococcales bacterium]